MAFIKYISAKDQPAEDRVSDNDHILQIHSVHSKLLKMHLALYKELMYGSSPLSRIQRELIAVVVSAENECHY
ncbi:MAG: carboxymuconolactone decarboxylase family protein [Candidatus Marinimicrobia bacterium]|nr:carboxymuconolactone decarboxylase family protein [Candidatus Neomarinimicrobiota bacterium]